MPFCLTWRHDRICRWWLADRSVFMLLMSTSLRQFLQRSSKDCSLLVGSDRCWNNCSTIINNPRKSFQKECVCWGMRGSSGRSQEAERRSTGEDFVHHIFMKASECGNLPTFGTWNPCGRICKMQVHGILVQLPLPEHINEAQILKSIRVDKDADGFAAENASWPLTAFGKCEPSRKSSLAVLGHTWLTCTYLLFLLKATFFFQVGNLCLKGGDPPLAASQLKNRCHLKRSRWFVASSRGAVHASWMCWATTAKWSDSGWKDSNSFGQVGF